MDLLPDITFDSNVLSTSAYSTEHLYELFLELSSKIDDLSGKIQELEPLEPEPYPEILQPQEEDLV